MKCIVTETSPERTNARPVTNEDDTPHIYATISEARAELKSNGYSYNRANDRYYIKGTEYRAYIIREDSEEYAYVMEQAEEQQATEPEPEPAQVAAEAESLKDVDAYAHDAKTNANAAAWALDRMTKDHRETAAELACFARACADLAKDAADKAAASYEHARRTYYADYQTSTYAAQALAIRAEQRDDAQKEAQRAEETAQEVEAIAAKASEIDDAPAPIYQRYELLAFLGDPDAYDVDAIEAEATEYDPRTGRTVWTPEAVRDLWSICERHELYSYAPAI